MSFFIISLINSSCTFIISLYSTIFFGTNILIFFVIQSLWHLRRFRDEFLGKSSPEHVHVGDPCVVCALYDIFIALSMASTDNRREAVAPTSLRVALSNLYPDSNFFQEVTLILLLANSVCGQTLFSNTWPNNADPSGSDEWCFRSAGGNI